MDFTIDLSSGVPIYRQIVNQVRYLIASGALRAGEELPPIRTLALGLKVTPNTIVKAYDELERASRSASTFAVFRGASATRSRSTP